MTILEVLFAIMITTIGLLGAISVFPVASEMARKGKLNDEVAICADTAVHKFDAQAMRRPDRWVRYVYNSNNSTYRLDTAQQLLNFAAPGEAYCIDPKFYAQNLMPNPAMAPNNVPSPIPTDPMVTVFPSVTQNLFGTAAAGPPRMARLTLWNNNPFNLFPMGQFQANLVFGFEDELVYERSGVQKGAGGSGADNSLPAFQIYSPIAINNGANILPGKREDEGKLSWMATLVPKIDQNTGAPDDKYVLSTVIFNKRSPNLAYNAPVAHEKSAIILGQSVQNANISDFHGNGFGGGEVTISTPVANGNEYLNVRAGDWVMLAGYIRGPVFGGSMATPPPFRVLRTFKWYRISEADEDPYVNGNYYQRDVTLVGPDWDQVNVCPLYLDSGVPVTSPNGPPDNFADDVEVFIIPNVIAVYERTVRLEGDGNGF